MIREKIKILCLILGIWGILLIPEVLFAVSLSRTLTLNMTVNARANLALGVSAINFPDRDPDTTPSVPATANPVSVTARVRTGAASTATLTHRAAGPLSAGGGITIPITNVSWSASGTGFVAGVMSSAASVPVGSWTGSGERTGNLNFFLANSWLYTTGNYTVSTTYTLTAP